MSKKIELEIITKYNRCEVSIDGCNNLLLLSNKIQNNIFDSLPPIFPQQWLEIMSRKFTLTTKMSFDECLVLSFSVQGNMTMEAYRI